MTSPTPGTILFQDTFSKNGSLDGANWDYNHWHDPSPPYTNPSYLGQTQMRQELPVAVDGVAKIRLDTFNEYNSPSKAPPNATDSVYNSFTGSEAITKQSWAVDATGGIAFEGTFRFPYTQGGMITGFFGYQDFGWPPTDPTPHASHDELDFEILTTQLGKISTNVFTNASGTDSPQSIAVPANTFQTFHTYRMEWYQDVVLWFIDGNLLRTEARKDYIPTASQQLHLNLWGVPGGPHPPQWDVNPGDPEGPKVGDPSFVPAATQDQNVVYYFDVTNVKVERLPAHQGTNAADLLTGSAASETISGGAGDDASNGGAGNDNLIGGAGNDAIDGGDGSDTAIFSGARSNYAVGFAGGVTTITDTRPDSPDGSDSLTNVEFAAFSDGLYALANGVLTLVPVMLGASTIVERIAQADAYVVRQGLALTVGAQAGVLSDDSSDTALHAALVQGPAHGTLQLGDNGSFTYTPSSSYRGIDSFLYRASDSSGAVGDAEVLLYVAPVANGRLDLGALTVEQHIASVYTGILGRGADLDGFQYWSNEFYGGLRKQDAAAVMASIAAAMSASDEAKVASAFLANPNGASDAQFGSFINLIYGNLFEREADAAGKAYWMGQAKQLVAAGQAPGSLFANILSGAQDSGQDITTLMNKVAVNLHYVEQQFLIDHSARDTAAAKALIDAVNSTQESVLVGLKQAEPLALAGTM